MIDDDDIKLSFNEEFFDQLEIDERIKRRVKHCVICDTEFIDFAGARSTCENERCVELFNEEKRHSKKDYRSYRQFKELIILGGTLKKSK